MKKPISPFKAALSLGWLGLVILLFAGAILWAQFSQSSVPFDAAQERMVVLNALEYDVQQSLNQMKLAEARQIYILQYELNDTTDYAQQAKNSDAKISEILKSLADEEYFTASVDNFVSDVSGSLDDFNQARAQHRQTFDAIVAAYGAKDTQKGGVLVETFQDENDTLDKALRNIIANVEQDRVNANRAFPEDINQSIYIATGGLVATLLLSLVGYQLISSAVRPLKSLRNTITAMEGDQYRPEMQADLLKKRGPAGELARALDQLAREIQQRDAGLKTEIENLRQALFESRRRRLKVFHETSDGSKQS